MIQLIVSNTEEDMIAGWIAANRGRDGMDDAQLAVWYYSFCQDIKMIFATVLGRKIQYAGEEI